MLRIALVTDRFSTGGGIEHIYQICRGMPDIEFGIFAKDGDAKYKFEGLGNVTIFPKGYDKTYIEKYKPDIVHIHSLKPLLKLYRNKTKTIFTVHGVHLHKYEFMQGVIPKILKFLRFNLEKYLYQRVDKIIAVSDDDKQFLKENYGIDSVLIYNGIDYEPIKKISLSKYKLREKLNIPNDKQIFLTVARFDFQKGYDVLIQAIKILKDEGKLKDELFLFVGDGKTMEKMKNKVSKLGLEKYILFLGKKRNIYEWMKASDCFILPSRWEGFPIVLIEAMACGLPIIASDTYGNRTVKKLEPKINLFENLNPLDLSKKILYIREIIGKKIEYSADFSLDKMISKLRHLYEDMS